MSKLTFIVAAAVLVQAMPAAARQVAGIDVPESVRHEDRTLPLNGAGVRRKLGAKIYVGALYLEHPSRDAMQILSTDQACVVTMTFLRDVKRGPIVDAFREGFEHNSPEALPTLRPVVERLRQGLSGVRRGGHMKVTYAPGQPVVITQDGGARVTFDRDAKLIAAALLRNWIGVHAGDPGLKKGLLAGP